MGSAILMHAGSYTVLFTLKHWQTLVSKGPYSELQSIHSYQYVFFYETHDTVAVWFIDIVLNNVTDLKWDVIELKESMFS